MKFTLLFTLLLFCSLSHAQLKTWDGGASTHNWEDAANWSPDGVPGILNDVEIDNDSVSISTNQTVKSILLESTHATLTDQAIFLHNGSTLSIFNSTGNGLELEDEARFWNAGSLIIVNATLQGIRVTSGVFENMANQGSISVSLSNSGITNESTFQNRNNAQISILDVSQFGIDNYSTSSQFSNRGAITISNTQFGTNNEGTFLNRGDLSIEKTSDIGLVTRTYFKNFGTGTVNLDTLYDEGVFAKDDFINEGMINIKQVNNNGIEDFAGTLNMVNSGSITISKAGENGMFFGTSGSVFTNEVGGEVLIDSTIESGIYTDEKLVNEGEISIHRVGRDGIEFEAGGDSLINKGLVSIRNTDRYGIAHKGSYFINESTGVINLDTLGATGLLVSNNFTNNGMLSIKNTAVHGIYNSLTTDSLVNDGTINIENAGLAGIEHHGSLFLNDINGTFTIDSTVGFGVEVFDKFINKGQLNIYKTGDVGLYNNPINTDSLFNIGSISIKESVSHGLQSSGSYFENLSSGTISIEDVLNDGIRSSHNFINRGSIDIKNTGLNGWYASPVSFLKNFGTIDIDNAGNSGMLQSSTLNNEAFGVINIHKSHLDGLLSGDLLVNNGTINIIDSEISGINNFVSNTDSLINNGLINIKNAGINGINHSGKVFINNTGGEILIDSTAYDGIYLQNKFINDGSIEVHNSINNGLNLIGDGTFINESSGIIMIDSSNFSGIRNDAMFLNDGDVMISNSNFNGIRNYKELINDGSISIKNSEDGIEHEGEENCFLKNGISGEITIDSSEYDGFQLQSRFENDGSLTIKNSEEIGLFNQNGNIDSLFNNGLITILNSEIGIANEGGYFLNGVLGEIVIDSTTEDGFVNTEEFVNEGSLIIIKAEEYGFENGGGATLINEGFIDISNSADGLLHFGSLFINKSSGLVSIDSIDGKGAIMNSKFLNEGSLFIRNTINYAFSSSSFNSDTITNNGLIDINNPGVFGLAIGGSTFFHNKLCGKIKLE